MHGAGRVFGGDGALAGGLRLGLARGAGGCVWRRGGAILPGMRRVLGVGSGRRDELPLFVRHRLEHLLSSGVDRAAAVAGDDAPHVGIEAVDTLVA